ncbi:MAG TPA: SelL-related redox protein [Chitinophagales bacterium]|nr:SelL-related redox protein [Chitinophagales bacterium]
MYFQPLQSRLNASIFISALYFMVWGVMVFISPSLLHSVVVEEKNTPIVFWDFMGIITFMLGVVLLIASFNPFKHWLIILLASLFHVGMITGFLAGFKMGMFNNVYLPFLFFNHIIWLIPNAYVLYLVYRRNLDTDDMLIDTFNSNQYPLALFDTTDGRNIGDLADQEQLLLVFLRHFGCPFCKESLLQLQEHRAQLESRGITIVLVYMVNDKIAQEYLSQYGLQDLAQVSDPEEIFYKSFRLRRGSFIQLFGIKVWARWISLGWRKRLFNTKPEGDVTQMPGIFLLQEGRITKQFVHKSVADKPDYTIFLD